MDRRSFLHLLGTISIGLGTGVGGNAIYSILQNLSLKKAPDGIDIKSIYNPEYLFWDKNNISLLPGNTNKRLLIETGGELKMSWYVNYATEMASRLLRKLNPDREVEVISIDDYRAHPERYKNLLLIGGPVANELTNYLCGYKNVPIIGEGNKSPKEIAIFTNEKPYPGYFNIGSPDKGYNKIEAIRPNFGYNDERKEDLEGTFSITYKGRELIPVIENGRLRSDMLMIIRIPNPLHPIDGRIMIIGGMHGYSLRAFFDKYYFVDNLNMLTSLAADKLYYQMLIPAEIDDNGFAKILWDDKRNNKWIDWRYEMDGLDPEKLDLI